jgi:hypothetical protein
LGAVALEPHPLRQVAGRHVWFASFNTRQVAALRDSETVRDKQDIPMNKTQRAPERRR